MLRFALGRTVPVALLAGLVIVSCADSTTETTQAEEMDMEEVMGSFGEPAEAADADRVIEITANDDFSFDPDEITVSVGEVITFRVVNGGALMHDFTLGDEATQEEHEEEMAEMAESGDTMMHNEPNTMTIGPGETQELTWRFTDEGSVLFGCHEVGHYASGMKGTITTES